MDVNRDWAPLGVKRFHTMVQSGFFNDGIAIFRGVKGFVVQFGVHGEPNISQDWKKKSITDDPVKESNRKGSLTFATAGKNTRTTQIFINLNDNARLDRMGFSPFAVVSEEKGGGMAVVDQFYTGYGDRNGPDQGLLQMKGNSYLKENFPKLDYILSARICNNDC